LKYKFVIKSFAFLSILLLKIVDATAQVLQPAGYVNPFIGTANNANTYPGAVVPWGMVSVNPFTAERNGDSYSATSYTKAAPFINGFSHVSLSGVGCPDISSIIVMPSMGAPITNVDSIKSAYINEIATAGYYSVELTNHAIKAELSATLRSGISQYTFTKTGKANVLLDLSRSLSNYRGASIKKINEQEVEGYKDEGNFCGAGNRQRIYFVMRIQKKNARIKLWGDNVTEKKEDNYTGNNIGCWFQFEVTAGEKIIMQVGISYVSAHNARLNLQAEQTGCDFEKVKYAAYNNWNKELSKIKVNGTSKDDKVIFYTGLYHTLIHPNVFNDANGEYISMTGKNIKKVAKGQNRYTVFSLWDTYRNLHSLLTLVYPERQSDMVQSMVDMYKESGWLPKWELAANETYIMVGDPAVAVIAETYLKGIKDFDVVTAYKAMLHNASLSIPNNPIRPGLKNYLQYQYIPNDAKDTGRNFVWGSVATTLEYCYADWCIAQMAKAMGNKKDEKIFTARSLFYKNLFDTSTNFIRPKLKDGSWPTPFDATAIVGELNWNPSGGPGFVEGNAWQYTWMIPHDIKGLSKLMDGEKAFTEKLQRCFDENQFVLWNEPDMAYPFLFNYAKGNEWHTQQLVQASIKKYFNNTPEGIPGNDDCGTTSAWLVFAMMGLYPACPASGNYAVTTPAFNEINITLNIKYYKGKNFFIKKNSTFRNERFILQLLLNGKSTNNYFISHKTITNGGGINYTLKENK